MKKLFVLVFSLMLVFGLVACDVDIFNTDSNSTTQINDGTSDNVTTVSPTGDTTSPDETTKDSVSNQPESTSAATTEKETTATVCSHKNTELINAKNSTCETKGYTGDTKCTDCGVTIKSGSEIAALGHKNTSVVGEKAATCTKNGYSGDTVCSACNKLLKSGSNIPATGHQSTKLVKAKEATCTDTGYTGDKVCSACNYVIEKGETIPVTEHHLVVIGYIPPTTNVWGWSGQTICDICYEVFKKGENIPPIDDGSIKFTESIISEGGKKYYFTIPTNRDPFEYTLNEANKTTASENEYIESRILTLINEKRAEVGKAPVTLRENAFYFVKKRADEIFAGNTMRPDGTNWYTVYYEEGVYMQNCREISLHSYNLLSHLEEGETVEEYLVEEWTKEDSIGREYFLGDIKAITVAVVNDGITWTAVVHLYS